MMRPMTRALHPDEGRPPRSSSADGASRGDASQELRLLVVEDNAGDMQLLAEMLREEGVYDIEVAHVESMRDAESRLSAQSVDLVLLDLGLPDVQGIPALQRIRRAAPLVPLVVLTDLDDLSMAMQALHEGAEDYLVKGQIEPKGLLRALRYAVGRGQLKAALLEERDGALFASRLFQALVENLPDVISRFDRELRHLYVSPSVEVVTGRPPGEFLGKTNRELGMPLELVEIWDAALGRVCETGNPERLEFAYTGPNGLRHFDCRLVPEFDAAGSTSCVLTVARDVTERWLALEGERRARSVAEELRDATVELTRSLDRESVLVTLLDRLRQLVPFDRASVMLLEKASRLSVRAVFDGERVVPLPADDRPEIVATDHPIVQSILATGSAVLIPDVSVHPDWGLEAKGKVAGSWMGVPLFARGGVAGLVSLASQQTDSFSEEQVRLAESMSSQASVAVENAVLFEQMQASTVRLQLLSRRLVEAQENERRHIARELHDEAGQSLASLRFGLRLLEREIDSGVPVAGRVKELMRRTDAVIDGLHRLAADLRPASLDHLGLEAALRQYCRSIAAKHGLVVHFKALGFCLPRLPAAVETALYRVAQEAMTNVLKHAGAAQIDVLVECRGDRVSVLVEDDGAGFEPATVQEGDHFGLLGMKERAEALGGTLTVESRPGSGTTILVEVSGADPDSDR